MRRPAEQTKLLFLYFLRSTAAALATPRPFASGPPHHALTMVPPLSLFGGGGGTMAGVLPRSRRIGSGSSADASRPVSGTTSGRAFRQASAPEREASPSPSDDAGDDDNGGDTGNHRNGDVPLLKNGHLTFRLARRTDVPQIQKCNLATLPENYNPHFYVNHMRTWPELCLVAEHVPGSDDDDDMAMDDADDLRDDVLSSPWEFYSNIEQYPTQRPKKQKEIVGYILGKVEERPVHPPPRQVFPPSRVAGTAFDGNRASPVDPPPLYNLRHPPRSSSSSSSSPPPPTERIGHVTSLAVHTHARRLGIASSLLHQLHYHLRRVHRCRAVGLHVRIGNKAAVKLYVEGMGYHVADIIPAYYGDGEDAYFMRKELCEEGEENGGDAATGGGDVVAGDGDGGDGTVVHGRKRMRGEKAREEWINKRSTARDRLSVEERGWYDRSRGRTVGGNGNGNVHTVGSIGSSSSNGISGMVQNGFRSLWHHGDGTNSSSVIPGGGSRRFLGGNRALPPWETGPDELRLPRYQKIVRRDEVEERRSESGKEVVQVGMEVQEVRQSRQ